MSVEVRQIVSREEFEAFIQLPQNSEKRFEWVMGEVVEVPNNVYVSVIAATISFYINLFLMQNKIGRVSGEGGGYWVNGQLYAPDVAYLSYDRQAVLDVDGFNTVPPQLAVEVISDPKNGEEQATLRRKLVNYLAADVMVWIVDPFARIVEVYEGDKYIMLTEADGAIIEGGIVLPEFKVALKDIFGEPIQ